MAASLSRLPFVAQMAVERLDEPRKRFVLAFFQTYDMRAACAEARVKRAEAEVWRDEPEVVTALKLIRDASSRATGVSYEYIIGMQKEVLERCMQHRPVVDRQGKVVDGQYQFDAFNANKAIENLAKMTGHMNGGGTTVNVNVANMSAGQRDNELKRILDALEARKNAGPIIEAEYMELPAPSDTLHEEPLFD